MEILSKKISQVLLIDDSESTNLYHQAILNETFVDIKTTYATSAQEALALIKGKDRAAPLEADIIFLDLKMPEKDGFSFLDEYVQLDREIVRQSNTLMVIVSDYLDYQNFTKTKAYKHLGLTLHHIRKPFRKDDLKELIDEFKED